MATLAGTALTTILDRARDPNATLTSRADALTLLSYAQQMANGATDSVVSSTALSLTAGQPLYSISTNFPACLRIVGVQDAYGRDLTSVPYQLLKLRSRRWLLDTADRPRSYTVIGHDLLAITPPPDRMLSITVFYTVLATALTSESQALQVPDNEVSLTEDIGEVLLVLRSRDLVAIKAAIERLQGRIAAVREVLQRAAG